MKGHVGKRPGKTRDSYYYKVYKGRDPVTGKKKYDRQGKFATEEEARLACDMAIAKIMQERAVARFKALMPGVQDVLSPALPPHQPPKQIMTIDELLDIWLRAVATKSGDTTTFDIYKSVADSRIRPALGHFYVHKFAHADAQDWVNSMQEEEVGTSQRKLAPITIRNKARILRTALNYAIDPLRLIKTNPATKLALPPDTKDKRQIVSPKQVQEILGLLQGTPTYMPAFLGFHTGLRIGEILGLWWSCIDFDSGTLEVKQNLKKITGKGLVLGTPKTKSSYRTIALNTATLRQLKEHQEQQKRKFTSKGKRWTADGPVIVNAREKYYQSSAISIIFKEKAEELGYPLTFHATRHAHATIALKGGIPMKVVSERLGHASIVITMDMYAHVLEGMDQEAADAFEREVELNYAV